VLTHQTIGRQRRSFLTVAVAICVIVGTACGGTPPASRQDAPPASTNEGTSPSVAGSPSRQPSASAAPDEAVASFLKLVAGPEPTAHIRWNGSIAVGDTSFKIRGELTDAGEDEETEFTLTIDGVEQVNETIVVGADTYRSQDGGPWFRENVDVGSHEFVQDLFADVDSLELVGTEGPRWRFSIGPTMLPPGLLQATFGEGNAVEITTTRFEVVLDGEGVPVDAELEADVMVTNDTGEHMGHAAYAWEFVSVGSAVRVRPPSPVWTYHHSSTIGYAIAHPETWRVEALAGGDQIISGAHFLTVNISPAGQAPASLELLTDQWATMFEQELGVPRSEMAFAETTLAGLPAVRMEFDATYGGVPFRVIDVASIQGTAAVNIYLYDFTGDTDAALQLVENIVATFSMAPR
jgi:hypothetical protein